MPDIPVTKVAGIAVFACYQGYGHRAYIPVTMVTGIGQLLPVTLVTGIPGMPARNLYILRIYISGIGQALCTGYAHPKCGAIEYAPTTG